MDVVLSLCLFSLIIVSSRLGSYKAKKNVAVHAGQRRLWTSKGTVEAADGLSGLC